MSPRADRAWYRMSRRQRTVVIVAYCVAAVGLLLVLTVDPAVGALVISAAGLTICGVLMFVAPPDPRA